MIMNFDISVIIVSKPQTEGILSLYIYLSK